MVLGHPSRSSLSTPLRSLPAGPPTNRQSATAGAEEWGGGGMTTRTRMAAPRSEVAHAAALPADSPPRRALRTHNNGLRGKTDVLSSANGGGDGVGGRGEGGGFLSLSLQCLYQGSGSSGSLDGQRLGASSFIEILKKNNSHGQRSCRRDKERGKRNARERERERREGRGRAGGREGETSGREIVSSVKGNEREEIERERESERE